MPDAITVEVATPADSRQVSAVLRASYRDLMAPAYGSEEFQAVLPVLSKANPELLGSGRYFVARHSEGQLVGVGGWSHERPGSGERIPHLGHLRHFGCHPEWIGRGIGRQLFWRCRDQALEEGIRRFMCFASLNAQGFYEQLGFSVRERISLEPLPGQEVPSLEMQLDL